MVAVVVMVVEAAVVVAVAADTQSPRLWLGNLLVFGALGVLVLVWFSFQTRQAQQTFLEEATGHARLLADAVSLHARGAVLGHEVTDAMLIDVLGNSARFVDYLDRIEAFREQELTAFAAEAGLAAIRIIGAEGIRQGPPDGDAGLALDCQRPGQLLSLPDRHVLVFTAPRQGRPGCVLVALDSRAIEELRDAIGLPRALRAIAALPGVVGVALNGTLSADAVRLSAPTMPVVAIRRLADGSRQVETRTPLAGAELRVDLDAGPLARTEAQLWRQFAGFAALLVLIGTLSAGLLYRYQRGHLQQLRAYEQRLSQQREEAALGQAAAAIAHELRNPLNAMAMGLQRLQIEADALDDEHRRLVTVMREAVARSNRSVTGLLDYARPYRPRQEPVALGVLVTEQLALYAGSLRAAGIQLQQAVPVHAADLVPGDPDLLRQVLDNLLRNALEAQPQGGWLQIRLNARTDGLELTLSNPGFTLPPDQAPRILEPWFTTKPAGTGLGLAISRRILAAHKGHLTVATPRPGELELRLFLPRQGLAQAAKDEP